MPPRCSRRAGHDRTAENYTSQRLADARGPPQCRRRLAPAGGAQTGARQNPAGGEPVGEPGVDDHGRNGPGRPMQPSYASVHNSLNLNKSIYCSRAQQVGMELISLSSDPKRAITGSRHRRRLRTPASGTQLHVHTDCRCRAIQGSRIPAERHMYSAGHKRFHTLPRATSQRILINVDGKQPTTIKIDRISTKTSDKQYSNFVNKI